MSKILITTQPDDEHALYVKLALERIGYTADLFYTEDWLTPSSEIGRDKLTCYKQLLNLAKQKKQYDVIWHRHPKRPLLTNFNDNKYSLLEAKIIKIFSNAKWINPIYSSYQIDSKLLQLKLADQMHLNIPKTFILNETTNNHDHTISIKRILTEKISTGISSIIQKTPPKNFKLHIIYFGNKYIAVKTDSAFCASQAMDNYCISSESPAIEQVTIPDSIDQSCQKIMKILNISFSCFRFIITDQNEYFFTGIDDQGEFFWIEHINPKIKMLKMFIEFIIGENLEQNLTLMSFHQEVKRLKEEAIKLNNLSVNHGKS